MKDAPILPVALAAFFGQLDVPIACFAECCGFLRSSSFRIIESLTERLIRLSNTFMIYSSTLVKFTLSGCTVLIASVLPCKKLFVIAGSYVHSVRPSSFHQHITASNARSQKTHHTARNTPPETPSVQMHLD